MNTEHGSPREEPKIGPALRRARTERGISLERAEEATKIRAGYLAALEREEFDVLPAVYVRGSLKTYANFLHLDGEALSRELRRRQEPPEDPQDPAPDDGPPPADPERPRLVPASLASVFAGASSGAGNGEAGEGRGTDEGGGRAGGILFPAGASYPYLVSGALLALVVVVAVLALTLPGDARTPVAQVHEPLASKADLTADVLVPLRDEPFRAAGEPIPEDGDEDRPEKRVGEKEKKAKKEKDGDSKPAKEDEPGAEAAQAPVEEPAPWEASAAPKSAPATAEPDPVPEPREEMAQVSSGSASSTAVASAPSSSAPAPASVPSSVPSSAPPPTTTDGGGPASVPPGVEAPVARPDGAEIADGMAEEIIAEVNAGLPAPARGHGPDASEQETPGDPPYDAPPDVPLP